MKSLVLFAVAAFLMGGAAMAKNDLAAKNAKTGNISKARREKLIANVEAIKAFLEKSADADTNAVRLLSFAAELEKEVRGKKYGLVFEEHRERVDVELDENVPVLSEVKGRFLAAKNAKSAKNGRATCSHAAAPLNFLIEGDNLAALKLLGKTHRGCIDLIYIDPPYNTGNKDFIYNDSYVDKTDTFRHSKWLSFMRSRLEIARQILSQRGAIFVSLNDVEQPSCRLLCDEIFGESNFCGQLIWRKKSGGGQTDEFFVTEHEYVLVYRKSAAYVWQDEEIETTSTFNHKDEKGNYKAVKLEKWGSSAHKEDRPTMWFPLKAPDGKNIYPIAPDGLPGRWRVGQKRMERLEKEDLISWRKDKDRWIPYEKIYGEGTTVKKIKQRSILYEIEETGDATKLLTEIFGKKDVFSNPKPVELVKLIIEHCKYSDIVLDFFAGSGTTGHAVMKLNAEDGGKRKFILVTNNENGICEKVTYERLKRVMEKEGYNAALKYFKIGYVPITEDGYWERADALLGYIRELVELENGIDFAHDKSVAIVLTDEELEGFVKCLTQRRREAESAEGWRVLYKGHNVILGEKAKAAIERRGIEVRTIPDYYYPELED